MVGSLRTMPFQPFSALRQQVGLKKLVNCLQIISRHLAALAISNEFVRDLLTFAKVAHASTLYSADVHECVGSAVIRLNEAKALGGVEPFYSSSSHLIFSSEFMVVQPKPRGLGRRICVFRKEKCRPG